METHPVGVTRQPLNHPLPLCPQLRIAQGTRHHVGEDPTLPMDKVGSNNYRIIGLGLKLGLGLASGIWLRRLVTRRKFSDHRARNGHRV